MPITADILAQLKKLQGQPTTSEAPSPFLKIPNSELLSKITRGAGPGLPSDAPMSGLPDAMASPPLERRQPGVRLGSSSPGVLGNVEARQQADEAGLPSAAVRNGEILPPKQHHGFWDRLKSVGEGALIGMGQQARQNAQTGREQSLESLLGAGAAGGVTGGVSPLTIDALRNREQGQRDVEALGQQQGLEKQRADVFGAQQRPLIDAARIQMEQQKAEDAARRADEANQIRRDANDIQRNRPTAQKQPIFKSKKRADGSEVTMRSDDNGATFKEVPELGSEAPPAKPAKESGLTPYQQKERQANAAKLIGKIDGARRDAENALKQAENLPDTDPNKATHIANYRQALADGNAAATELGQAYGDLYEAGPGTADESGKTSQGVQWPYYKPKSRLGSATGGMSDPRVKQYADKFFGGDIKKAQDAINKQRGQ